MLFRSVSQSRYERSNLAFKELGWASNYERAKRTTDSVFMDNYVEVVKELVAAGIKQEMHVNPVELPKPKEDVKKIIPVGDPRHTEYLEKLRALVKQKRN